MWKKGNWEILFLMVHFFYFSGHTYGQTENRVNVFSTPDQYLYNTKLYGAYKKSISFIDGKPWVVFSDRDNNVSFAEPNSRHKKYKKNIAFKEQFYVIGETTDFVHIVKCDTLDLVSMSCSKKQLIDYGWILKDHLLLSNRSLVYNGNMFPVKMLYVGNRKNKTQDNIFSLDLAVSPKLSKQFSVNLSAYQYLFFYLYKVTPTAYLIGDKERFHRGGKTCWLGWVDKKVLSEWKGEALEPNWDENAVRERKLEDITPSAFKKISSCFLFCQGDSHLNPIWPPGKLNLNQAQRLPGNYYRFPVISEGEKCYLSLYYIKKTAKKKVSLVYLPKTSSKLKYPLFVKVLLLSRYQLGNMISEYSQIRDLYDKKMDWEQAVILFAKKNFSDVGSQYIDLLTWGALTNYFWGYQSRSAVHNLRLKYLSAAHFKNDKRLNGFKWHLSDKIRILSGIFNSDDRYPYSVNLQGKIFYWVDMDDLL